MRISFAFFLLVLTPLAGYAQSSPPKESFSWRAIEKVDSNFQQAVRSFAEMQNVEDRYAQHFEEQLADVQEMEGNFKAALEDKDCQISGRPASTHSSDIIFEYSGYASDLNDQTVSCGTLLRNIIQLKNELDSFVGLLTLRADVNKANAHYTRSTVYSPRYTGIIFKAEQVCKKESGRADDLCRELLAEIEKTAEETPVQFASRSVRFR